MKRPERMPLPISLAHRLARRLTALRKEGTLPYLRPDGKTQVTVEYDGNTPVRIEAVVVSTQHDADVSLDQIRRDLIERLIRPEVPAELLDDDTKIFVNPTGRFVVGGPQGDSGLTGRKIIVDTYGGYARHGGGAFSGKDPTKVDRSASYMAATRPRTWWLRALPAAARYSLPTPSAWPGPCRCWWIPRGPERYRMTGLPRRSALYSIPPRRHH